ncbi:MAG: pyruvate kinase [Candidatus Nanoarchaeia archaeon]
MKQKINAIVTSPPYSNFIEDILDQPIVSGIRLNTVMPLKESYEDALKRLNNKTKEKAKDLWIDLKCRQLRVKEAAMPPYTEIKISHEIDVLTPCKAYFSDRSEYATILEIDKDRLIMQEGPKRLLGPGESITIPHPTLKINGYFTDTDKKYIEAANKLGINNYMLSFVEKKEDIQELRKYNPCANIIAKIESQKGMNYVINNKEKDAKLDQNIRLMAARGDLYMELTWPHVLPRALETILKKDPNAIVASRILESLVISPEPSCSDISDVDNLLRMGYQTFMFGDEVCLEKNKILAGINILDLMSKPYLV